MHYTPLISILVTGLGLAFLFGFIAHRLHLSPIIGYLLAGVLIGPSTPGYIADPALASELAELGIILLMFGVGLHFSLHDLQYVKRIAIPGALVQIVIATLLGTVFSYFMGWPLVSGIVFGFTVSVASTVVLLKALEEWHLIHTINGKITIAWLIVEDLAVVLILVFLPPLASLSGLIPLDALPVAEQENVLWVFLVTLFKASAFIILMFILGRRLIPQLLQDVARAKSNELFRLAVLSIALVIAFIASKLFGVSFALGAFFAGMILNESTLSQRAAEETLPLREAFAVLFFISVGMLMQPQTIIDHPFLVLATSLIIIVGKSAAAFVIVMLFRYPVYIALTISASLAQIGEFSFILAEVSYKLGILTQEMKDLILAGAFISIALNPLLFNGIQWLHTRHLKTAKTKAP